MRILIFGAGVIGSLYAVLFSNAGYDTYIHARGKRLAFLKEHGLLYLKHGRLQRVNVTVVEQLADDDIYDYIFLALRQTQLYAALAQLRSNRSQTIVTMVNSIGDYLRWEAICGEGRILPAFPGAGGGITNGVLDAELTPRMVQRTTFGEISGQKSQRSRQLARIFRTSRIPFQMVSDMRTWQLSHLAMVVSLADAYYESDDPSNVGKDRALMRKTSERMKQNFSHLVQCGIKLSPAKMYMFYLLSTRWLQIGLGILFRSKFGHKMMYKHAMNARDEMECLHDAFYACIDTMKTSHYSEELAD